jgi:hypothetical protein
MAAADGNWKITLNTPMGAQTVQLEVKTSGDTFSGKVQSQLGNQDVTGKVSNGGNKLNWTGSITNPMPMDLDYELNIDGDKGTGTVTAGSFGSFSATAVRA